VVDVLYASGELLEAVVVGEPDEQRGERIIAYVVLTTSGSLSRLQSYARMELPRYMQPARFEVRDSLPRLPSGKHDVAGVAAAAR
jgi:acyl-CoA synthetase (AMP-forming)/AMP-acid ligase II